MIKDCPKKGDLKCKAHPTSNSHTDLACFYCRKSQGLPIMTRPRPDGSKDSDRGAPTPPPSQNLVLATGDEDVDFTEIYTSDEELQEANTAQLDSESESVDTTEYFSDGLPEDHGDTPEGVPLTPPRPRDEAGAFHVILNHDEDLDLTVYYTESEDEGMDDTERLEKYTQFPLRTKFYYSDSEKMSDNEEDDNIADEDRASDGNCSLNVNVTSESAYKGDISNQAENMSLPLDIKPKKKLKRNRLTPILRRSYYGPKRLMTGKRHFISSVIEYAAGATLGSSFRKIPFYSLLVSPDKPTTKNKVPDPIQANVICDTGTSISLPLISIAQKLKMRIDKSHLISVRGGDRKKLSSMGTSFVYMKVPASPSWRRVKVIVTKTGENFLLSHANLKNLGLLSTNFPEYIGQRRRAYVQSV